MTLELQWGPCLIKLPFGPGTCFPLCLDQLVFGVLTTGKDTNPEIGFHSNMPLMLDAVLESNTVEYLQCSYAQTVRLAREHFGASLVDDSGSHAAAGHPVRGHKAGGPGADDEPVELGLSIRQAG